MKHKARNMKFGGHTKASNPLTKRLHFGMFYASGFRLQAARGGFTMVEIVIMLAIIITISAIVLVSFPNVSRNINMQRSVQRFSLSFREMQDHALAVREVQGPSGPVIPPAVGIHVVSGGGGYILFADMDTDGIFNLAGGDIPIETRPLERNIRFLQILDELNQEQTVANVTFTVPSATMNILNNSETIGESVLFVLHGEGAFADRKIRVRTSGQISTE